MTLVAPGVRFSGVVSNIVSTPDIAAHEVVDVDCIVRASLDDWTPAATQTIFTKGGFLTVSWAISVNTNGTLLFTYSTNGTAATNVSSTAAPVVADGARLWLRATFDSDNGAAGNTVRFWTAPDQTAVPTSWTPLGAAVVTGGTVALYNSAIGLSVGAAFAGAAQPMIGVVHYAELRAAIDGAPVAVFNAYTVKPAASYANGSTHLSPTTGETWTFNSSGAPGLGFLFRRLRT